MPFDFLYDGANATSATFTVEVDGVPIGRFTEVNGLEVTLETEEFKEGGVNDYVHHLPTRLSWPNITLKRGITFENLLYTWFSSSVGKKFARTGKAGASRSVAITLVSATGKRLRSWELEDAYPVKWTGPTFATESSDFATEQLEIAHSGFTATTPLLGGLA
jgi:phage tail-like protein